MSIGAPNIGFSESVNEVKPVRSLLDEVPRQSYAAMRHEGKQGSPLRSLVIRRILRELLQELRISCRTAGIEIGDGLHRLQRSQVSAVEPAHVVESGADFYNLEKITRASQWKFITTTPELTQGVDCIRTAPGLQDKPGT